MGKYDVAATVGPNVQTKRQEAVDALTMILTEAPALTSIIGDILMRNLEFDDAQEAALRLKRLVPPQALGYGPTPNEQQQTLQIQQLQSALAKAMQQQGRDALRLIGKDQMRDIDVYKAETDRVKALSDLLPTDPQGLQELIAQLIDDALQTNLMPLLKANIPGVGEQSGGSGAEDQTGRNGSGTNEGTAARRAAGVAPGSQPPMPGAQQADDGQWYILDPTRRTRYLRVGPLIQERSPPGARTAGS
jgi:hypothetical protein